MDEHRNEREREHEHEAAEEMGVDDGGAVSGDVLHGGEGDPLGEGVSELQRDDEVTEGVPEQEGELADGKPEG